MTAKYTKIPRISFFSLAVVSMFAITMFASVARAQAEEVTINVMKHICDEDIQSLEDFESVDGPDDNTTTEFHDKVLFCPTVVMEGDEYVDGAIHHEDKHDFNFVVEGDDGEEMDIDDAEYTQMKLCESDVDFDVNGDGEISEDTCLGTSMYSFANVEGGDVEVTETETPGETRPGALEFTPDAIAENDDADTLAEDMGEVFGEDDHTVMLDTTEDDDDNVVTLHVYNFQGEEYGEDNGDDDENNDTVEIDTKTFSALIVAINDLLQTIQMKFL